MTVSLAGLTLHVADVDRSLAFYRRLPGAAVLLHLPGRFALLQLGQGRLGLLADRGRPFHIELEVPDLDAAAAGDLICAAQRILAFSSSSPCYQSFTVGMEDMPPGDSIGVHKHRTEDEIVFTGPRSR